MTAPSIGIDLMGGDKPPHELLSELAPLIQSANLDCDVHFYADEKHIESWREHPFIFHVAKSVISMDEDPLHAVRRKKDSSMALGITALKEGEIDLFISTGNTGALSALTTLNLPQLKRGARPALLTFLPSKKKRVAILDVGANVHALPEQLVGYAHLGSAVQKTLGFKSPKIGLLNIGSEESKGREEERLAHSALASAF